MKEMMESVVSFFKERTWPMTASMRVNANISLTASLHNSYLLGHLAYIAISQLILVCCWIANIALCWEYANFFLFSNVNLLEF